MPRMGVGEMAATTLALIIHELATNSVKYGCLSAETGTLDVSGVTEDEEILLAWTERGGPAVDRENRPDGYGSKLLQRSVTMQLGGSIDYDWTPEGVVIQLRLKTDRLAH